MAVKKTSKPITKKPTGSSQYAARETLQGDAQFQRFLKNLTGPCPTHHTGDLPRASR